MDLLDIIAPLPETNEVKRLICFCLNELKMDPHAVAWTLARAERFASGVSAISEEAHRQQHEQDEAERREAMFAKFAKMNQDLAAMKTLLD